MQEENSSHQGQKQQMRCKKKLFMFDLYIIFQLIQQSPLRICVRSHLVSEYEEFVSDINLFISQQDSKHILQLLIFPIPVALCRSQTWSGKSGETDRLLVDWAGWASRVSDIKPSQRCLQPFSRLDVPINVSGCFQSKHMNKTLMA